MILSVLQKHLSYQAVQHIFDQILTEKLLKICKSPDHCYMCLLKVNFFSVITKKFRAMMDHIKWRKVCRRLKSDRSSQRERIFQKKNLFTRLSQEYLSLTISVYHGVLGKCIHLLEFYFPSYFNLSFLRFLLSA